MPARLSTALLALALVAIPFGSASAEDDPLRIDCMHASTVELEPGDVVTDYMVGAEVPFPDESVWVIADQIAGYQELIIDTTNAGEVLISGCGPEGDGLGQNDSSVVGIDADDVDDVVAIVQDPASYLENATATDPDEARSDENPVKSAERACKDTAYTLKPWMQKSTYRYYIHKDSIPSYLNKNKAVDAINESGGSITNARNSCGLNDNISATKSYQGTSNGDSANIRVEQGDTVCTAADSKNVIDFGNTHPGALAVACTWSRVDGTGVREAYDGDIRFNKTDGYSWYEEGACSAEYSIRAVGAHEFGHVFGLGHVNEARHGNLTMSKQSNGHCQESEFTLGKGDVHGLRVRY